VTFTQVYTTILKPSCAIAGACHSAGTPSAILQLTSQAMAFTSLVGIPAAPTGGKCGTSGLTRVVAGNHTQSLLYQKVQARSMGVKPVCGDGMPDGGKPALSQANLMLLQAWIDQGAPNN
jgi:hypothetical protein